MGAWQEKTGLGGETITFAQCWELARRWYPGRERLDWQPRSPAETQRTFTEVGLTSPFWDVTGG